MRGRMFQDAAQDNRVDSDSCVVSKSIARRERVSPPGRRVFKSPLLIRGAPHFLVWGMCTRYSLYQFVALGGEYHGRGG